MLEALLAAATLATVEPGALDAALERFRNLQSYRTTIHSSHEAGEEHLRYFYRKPGHIRMEFIRPHAGAVLIYDPGTRRVKLWPFGIGRFPELDLSPDNRLIRSPRGQQVDKSDIGVLLANVRTLQQNGSLRETDEQLDQRSVRKLDVTGNADYAVAGVHRYEIWLAPDTLFPLKVVSRDTRDAVLETVIFENMEIDPGLPDALFAADQ
jgi:outer membrane lipoprotein-sorting protein